MGQYKPVHVITNDPHLKHVFDHYKLKIEAAAQCYTREGGIHWHYLIHWDVRIATPDTSNSRWFNSGFRLSPLRETLAKYARRRLNCTYCGKRGFNGKCPACGHLYKFVWCKNDEHHTNTARYILRKGPQAQIVTPSPNAVSRGREQEGENLQDSRFGELSCTT